MQDEAARWVMDALTRYEAALLRYATTLVGESQAADVVQDTFLELCRANRESVEGHLAAWLFTVCKHRAFDLSRKARRLHSLEEADVNEAPDSGPVSKLERKEAMTRIGAALESLPEREREALVLKLDAGLSYREIAEVMGLTTSNVGFILHTAVTRMKREIAAESGLPARTLGRTS
jgi:RNA polymerase sigma-70 factor (ECF subfamily)